MYQSYKIYQQQNSNKIDMQKSKNKKFISRTSRFRILFGSPLDYAKHQLQVLGSILDYCHKLTAAQQDLMKVIYNYHNTNWKPCLLNYQ